MYMSMHVHTIGPDSPKPRWCVLVVQHDMALFKDFGPGNKC